MVQGVANVFNLDKCKVMHLGFNIPHVDYFMDAIQMQEVHEEKDLGCNCK